MGDSVQKSRREVWSQQALSTLRRAVEAQRGGDSDIDWAEVAQKLGCTVSDLVAFFNMNLQDPKTTSAELEHFVISGVRSLEQVHCALPVDAADTTATHSLIGALLLARRYKSGFAPCG